MSKRQRLGMNPLDELIKDTRDETSGKRGIKKSEHHDIAISERTIKEPERFKQIREAIKEGKTTNYYLSKNGEIMQRVLIHLPFELAEKLKKQAFESIPRITLSGLIRKKLK